MVIKILIGIICVVVIIYCVILFFQHSLLNKLNVIEQNNNKIDLSKIKNDFNKASKLSLTGESLDQFKDLKNNYNKLQQSLEDINKQIKNIKSNSKDINFFNNIHKCQKVSNQIDKVNNKLQTIRLSLDKLLDLSRQHQKSLHELNHVYKKIRKNLLANNYIYGPTTKNLENNLSSLEKLYRQFAQLVQKGDHKEADKILSDLNSKTSELQAFIRDIPSLYKKLATLYPKQIDEISSGYRQMINDNYHFPEAGMDNAIEYVKKRINISLIDLEKLNINQVKTNNHQIENMINQLYDSMEEEIKAKRKVNHDLDIVTAYITHAQRQNYSLGDELQRLSKNYDLNHNEVETTNHLKEKLIKIDSVHQQDLEDMANENAVYSIILHHQEKAKNDLSQIESQQRQINSSVYDLNEEEANAKDNVQKFDLELHNIRRKIENLNLPGISNSYMNKYNLVYKEVKRLSKEMNKVKISMDDINKRLSTIRTDMGDLNELTDHLIDNAILSEQLMQYSNRYRNSYEDIADASAKAKQLFDNQYKYSESLKTIVNAIEKIEPGIYQKIKDNYYEEKRRNSENEI